MILNIAFFGILGLGLLGGLAKGFKKSLFAFITMAIFYTVFFLTLDAVVGFLWTYENPAIGEALANVDPSLSAYNSLGEAITPLLQVLVPDFDFAGANAELAALLAGIGLFLVKIGYTVFYFTGGFIVWKIVCWIFQLIFIHHKPGASKNRLLGGIFGLANGALALFVLFIMLGGVVNIVSSVSTIVPTAQQLANPRERNRLYEASQSLIPLAEGTQSLDEALAYVNDFVAAYEENPLVRFGNMIPMGEDDVPLSLYLFDSVMSFEYEGETIALRQELATVAAVTGAFLDALDAAGIDITNMEEVDFAILIGAVGSVDLTMLLDSKLISNALVYVLSGDAGVEGLEMIVVPDDIDWYDTVDDEGNLVEAGELRKLLTALNEIVAIAGAIDFENIDFTVITTLTDDAIDALFDSAVLTATISYAISDMVAGEDTLVIPDSVFDADGNILKAEMVALVHAVKLVVETVGTDPENFDFAMMLQLEGEDVDTLLDSQILSATVGKLLADLTGEDLTVPSTVLDSTTFEVDGTAITVVSDTEIKAVFASLAVLGISDFENMTFDATILANLEGDTPGELDDDKIATLFGSHILHATMSQMILDATAEAGSVLAIPYYDADGDAIRETLGTTVVISVAELGNVLKALYALDIEDFANFNELDAAMILEKMPAMLGSAILHATISGQLLSISGDFITIPYVEEDGTTPVRVTVGAGIEETVYISADELEAVIGALEALAIDDPADFDGTVSLSFFSDADIRAALLASAIMQATISDQLISLGAGILVIPAVDVDGNDVRVTVGPVGFETEYVKTAEIDAMFDALVILDVGGVDGMTSGEFTLANLLAEGNLAALLASASMHATISKQLLDTAAGTLLIPDVDVEDANAPIRITQGAVEFVAKEEIIALVDAFGLLGLTGFDALDFSVATLFTGDLDFAQLLASASLQATISDLILPATVTELTMVAGNADLVVPTVFRDDITVDGAAKKQIDGAELALLLDAMRILGLGDYGDALDPTIVTGLTAGDIDAMLASGSIHVTLYNMLADNGGITTPDLAKEAALYGVSGLTKALELRRFIVAANAIGAADFSAAGFTVGALNGLTPSELDVILDSMIVRDTLTPQIELADGLDPGYALEPSDYMEANITLFLTEQGVMDYLNYLP